MGALRTLTPALAALAGVALFVWRSGGDRPTTAVASSEDAATTGAIATPAELARSEALPEAPREGVSASPGATRIPTPAVTRSETSVAVSGRLVGGWPDLGCTVTLWTEDEKGRACREAQAFPVRGDRLLLPLKMDTRCSFVAARIEAQGGHRLETRVERPRGERFVDLGDLPFPDSGALRGLVRAPFPLRELDWRVTVISREPVPVGVPVRSIATAVDDAGGFDFPRVKAGRTRVTVLHGRLGAVAECEVDVPVTGEAWVEIPLTIGDPEHTLVVEVRGTDERLEAEVLWLPDAAGRRLPRRTPRSENVFFFEDLDPAAGPLTLETDWGTFPTKGPGTRAVIRLDALGAPPTHDRAFEEME